jgi:hypothetical protein
VLAARAAAFRTGSALRHVGFRGARCGTARGAAAGSFAHPLRGGQADADQQRGGTQ